MFVHLGKKIDDSDGGDPWTEVDEGEGREESERECGAPVIEGSIFGP